MRKLYGFLRRVAVDALGHFLTDDGWALASHVALSGMMALFPFLIFATALASFLGASAFTDTAVHVIFDTWPEVIATPIAHEVRNVLNVQRGGLLTISVIAAAYFASNGIEALRVALNRAYRVIDTRSIIYCRLQSLGYVVVATIGIMAISFLLVLAPLAVRIAERWIPEITLVSGTIGFWRYCIATAVLIIGLLVVHLWLPAGRTALRRHPARHPAYADRVDRRRGNLCQLSRNLRVLCLDLCGTCLDHGSDRLSVYHRGDLHHRR